MNNKLKIKRAALFLFAEKGFDKTSVREIAREVEIRESAIYNHYKSKTEIFNDLLNDARNVLHFYSIIDDNLWDMLSTPEKFLNEFAIRIIKHWSSSENKAYTKLIIQGRFNSSFDFDFNLEDFYSDLRNILNVVFLQLIKYGFIKKYPVDFLIDEYLSPLIVIKFKFLINDFFDSEQVFVYVNRFISQFWEFIKKDNS